MSKLILLTALTLFRVGRPDSIESSSSSSPSSADSPVEDVKTAALEYTGIKHLNSDAEFKEFTSERRFSMIYFKPEAELDREARLKELTFLNATKEASEYLRWGFDVRVAQMDCVNVVNQTLRERVCDPQIAKANVARFYKGKREMLDLELDTLFDEDSIISNILTIVLINDIPIIEEPNEIMELQDRAVGKQNIVLSYNEKIGSPSHRNVMEIAYNYKSKFQFVITSYNDSLAYLHLPPGLDIHRLPNFKIFVLLCAEAEYAPCPLTALPDSNQTLTQNDFSTYLDNILLDPILEYPNPGSGLAPESVDLSTFKSGFAVDTSIHEMRMIFDTRAARGEEAKKFLRDMARGLSLEYRGLVGFVLIDRAAQEGPVFPSVTVTIRPLNRDPEKPPPADKNYHFDDAFAFDGPSFQSFKRDLDQVVVLPQESFDDAGSDPGEETLEDDTVRSVEMFWKGHNPDEGGASWKNIVFDHVPQPKQDKKEFVSLLKSAGGKPKMVLFYLKADGTSMAAALAFGTAAKKLNANEDTKDSLLRIQCMDWPDICEKYGVFVYPTVKIFTGHKKGAEESEEDFATRDWKGLIDVDIVVAMANLLRGEVVLKAEGAAKLLADEDFGKAQLMLLTARLDKMKRIFEDMATRHRGEAAFVAEEGQGQVSRHCGFPNSGGDFVLISRPWDRLQPRLCLDLASAGVSSAEGLWKAISSAALRSPLPELTVKTFPQVVGDRKPLLILFVDQAQGSEASRSVEVVEGQNVALRFAEALIKGPAGGGVAPGEEEAVKAVGKLEVLKGVSVAWMNVASHPVHKEIFKSYHPIGMDQSLPAVSYLDLKQGKVVNIPFELATQGGSAWISGAAAKVVDHRTVSSPSVPKADMRKMWVVQLEKGDVGPSRPHINFKQLILDGIEEKKNRTKNRKDEDDEEAMMGPESEKDEDDDEEKEIDLRGIGKKKQKASEKKEPDEMPEPIPPPPTGEEEAKPDPMQMSDDEFAEEIVSAENFWKRDPNFLKEMIKNVETEVDKKGYNRLIRGLIERNPEKKDELESLALTLEMPKSLHEEL